MLIFRRVIRVLALTLLLSVLASGAAESAFPYSFIDSTGTTVTLPEPPQTVCVLFSSYAEIWTLAGGEVAVTVGESVERGFADARAILVDSGAGHSAIDLETLIMARPDFVIATADYACQQEAAQFCRSVGIPAALLRVEGVSDYLNALQIFTDITGRADLYEQNGIEMERRIADLFQRLDALPREAVPRILFVRAGSSARSTKAKTAEEHFAARMLAELGAQNIADSENGLTGQLSLEIIVREDPDFLFISTMGDEAAARDFVCAMLASDGWEALSCVQKGNWCFLDKNLFHFKPNARWAEAYEALAALLYPALTS